MLGCGASSEPRGKCWAVVQVLGCRADSGMPGRRRAAARVLGCGAGSGLWGKCWAAGQVLNCEAEYPRNNSIREKEDAEDGEVQEQCLGLVPHRWASRMSQNQGQERVRHGRGASMNKSRCAGPWEDGYGVGLGSSVGMRPHHSISKGRRGSYGLALRVTEVGEG